MRVGGVEGAPKRRALRCPRPLAPNAAEQPEIRSTLFAKHDWLAIEDDRRWTELGVGVGDRGKTNRGRGLGEACGH